MCVCERCASLRPVRCVYVYCLGCSDPCPLSPRPLGFSFLNFGPFALHVGVWWWFWGLGEKEHLVWGGAMRSKDVRMNQQQQKQQQQQQQPLRGGRWASFCVIRRRLWPQREREAKGREGRAQEWETDAPFPPCVSAPPPLASQQGGGQWAWTGGRTGRRGRFCV
jgi:hypothetical protein